MMRIRLRAPGGQHTAEVATDSTFRDLKAVVAEKTGIPPEAQELLAGFPPKVLTSRDGDSCASCGVSNGESITVRELPCAAAAAAAAAQAAAPAAASEALASAPAGASSPGGAGPAAAFNPVDEDEACDGWVVRSFFYPPDLLHNNVT